MKTMRARLLASSMITGAAIAALTASSAQAATATATDTTSNPSTVGEVVVTGSRIPQPNLTSVSPVNTVNAQELKLQGTTNVEDLIDNLPQAFGDFGTFESNGATGTATIDLRGLGSKRTLVLINGVRLQPGDPTVPSPDIDMIPPALIDRVEVLTGGASAVYGSDAVSGVVNFIMKTHFEGLQVDEETSIAEDDGGNQQVRKANANGVSGAAIGVSLPTIPFPGATWDGIRQTTTITGGVNAPDGKGNAEFFLGYTYIEPVNQGQRDYTKCSLATNTGNSVQYCGGSSTDATGRMTVESGPNKGKGYNILGTPTTVGGLSVLPAFNNGQDYNYAPLNYLQRPDQRYTAGEFSDYQVNKALDFYSSFMFMDDHSVAAEAGSGSFYGDEVYTIPCADPLLSTAQANSLCGAGPYTAGQNGTAAIGRRDIEGGPRTADLEHMDYRIVFGAKGDLGDGWNYDFSGLYGRSVLTESQGGYFLNSHLVNAFNVVSVGGVPTCASVVAGTDTSCVPYNIFSPGGVSKAALQYLEGLAENSGSTTEQIINLNFSNGDLSVYGLKSPLAKDGLGFSGGLEYRQEGLETQYDAAIASGDLAGFGGSLKNTSGSQTDKDIFVELRAPLIQDAPFAKDVELEAGYRYADYSHGGGNSTYKVGLDWQTIPDLRLRGSYERAVRAPNVQELFDPATPGLFAGSDPCAGAAPGLSAAQCFNTIKNTVPTMSEATFASTVYGHIDQCVAGQCGAYSGGNPSLQPETADTYSVGFVLTPSFIRNFSLSVDYWDIDVQKAIVNLSGTVLLTNCATLDNAYDCSQITRNAGLNYDIYGGEGAGFVDLQLVNASALKTNGIDVNGTYRLDLGDFGLQHAGSLGFAFDGTYVFNLITQLPDGTSYNCVGLYGVTCGIPTPHWRHQFRVTWNTPWNMTFSVNWRYLSGSALDFNTNQSDLQDGTFKDTLSTDMHIPAYSYFDLSGTWRIRDNLGLRAGVNNIFDKTPPLLDANSYGISAPPFGNGNTYPQVYDPLGRTVFLGLTADF